MAERKRLNYAPETMDTALKLIKNDGVSVRSVSKMFNIPRSTLQDKLLSRYKGTGNYGAPTVLSLEEEEKIVDWIVYLGELGFPVTKVQLIETVTKLISNLSRPNPFQDGIPGRHWYAGFLKRHPKISKRVPQSLTTSRAAITE